MSSTMLNSEVTSMQKQMNDEFGMDGKLDVRNCCWIPAWISQISDILPPDSIGAVILSRASSPLPPRGLASSRPRILRSSGPMMHAEWYIYLDCYMASLHASIAHLAQCHMQSQVSGHRSVPDRIPESRFRRRFHLLQSEAVLAPLLLLRMLAGDGPRLNNDGLWLSSKRRVHQSPCE